MKKRIASFVFALILLITSSIAAFAAETPNSIQSDPIFYSISTTLTTYKTASFSADTNDVVGYIKIWRCWLQKKVDGEWVFASSLPHPTYVEYNTIGYDAYMDYSSYIPSDGNTYRIGVRWEADGHYVTRYSNQRTF